MSKKNKVGAIIPFTSNNQKDEMRDKISAMVQEDIDMMDNHYLVEQMMDLVPSIMSAAIDVAKLVVDNRVKNSEKMKDEDIYQIYRASFKHIQKVLSEEQMTAQNGQNSSCDNMSE